MKGSLQINIQGENKNAINLDGSMVTIGRDLNNKVVLPSEKISRFHIKVYFENGSYYIEDTSTNGSFFNGRHFLKSRETLKHGDVIKIEDYEIIFMAFALDEWDCVSDQKTFYSNKTQIQAAMIADYSVFFLQADRSQKQEFKLMNGFFSIGTDEKNHIKLEDTESVKALHCSITVVNDKPFFHAYRNDALINGIKVDGTPILLSHGDIIEISGQRLQFKDNRSQAHRETYKIITQAPSMYAVIKKIEQTAHYDDIPVLITGETGSGKELVAKAIHTVSARRDKPFVSINCASINEKLAESILFGHVRGAFTDATSDHIGYFEQADGGTLFLDEVGELSPDIQAKLLRTVEYSEIRKVGATKNKNINVRIIAATNRKLEDASERDAINFRHDLFYRLRGIPIILPPLRARKEDIPLLMNHFLDATKAKYPNLKKLEYTKEAYDSAMLHDWHGNVRELYNACLDAFIGSWSDKVKQINSMDVQLPPVVIPSNFPVHLKELEVMLDEGITKTEIAKKLNFSRTTVYNYLEQLAQYRAIYPKELVESVGIVVN